MPQRSPIPPDRPTLFFECLLDSKLIPPSKIHIVCVNNHPTTERTMMKDRVPFVEDLKKQIYEVSPLFDIASSNHGDFFDCSSVVRYNLVNDVQRIDNVDVFNPNLQLEYYVVDDLPLKETTKEFRVEVDVVLHFRNRRGWIPDNHHQNHFIVYETEAVVQRHDDKERWSDEIANITDLKDIHHRLTHLVSTDLKFSHRRQHFYDHIQDPYHDDFHAFLALPTERCIQCTRLTSYKSPQCHHFVCLPCGQTHLQLHNSTHPCTLCIPQP